MGAEFLRLRKMISKSQTAEISGLIPILKPVGLTSKDVSRALTRRFGKIKLGHVGTLDPQADGVLPVLIGRGTKLQDYLVGMNKAYQFEMELGVATDSLDAAGQVVGECPWEHVTEDQISALIPRFVGELPQIPPLYSAVKFKGKELYKYAHAGKTAEDLPLEDLERKVTIYCLTLDYCRLPHVGFTVACSKGTYVRTLATDLATRLGTIGYVTRLTRISSAGFCLEDCITLDQATAEASTLESVVIPIDNLSIGLPTWVPDDMVTLQRLIDGQNVVMNVEHLPFGSAQSTGDILARSSDARSVGIIECMPLEGGRVKLHMKRGL